MSQTNPRFAYDEVDPNNDLQREQLDSASDDAAAIEASAPFVGQWQKLISQTNWEKGRIILQWRNALLETGASVVSFSDEAWARIVGGITSQHVGRLRRVYERFGDSQNTYKGLYWSHFLAAIDWDDAEMWLEGASGSDWSVSQMRRSRWEAMGSDPNAVPNDSQMVAGVVDEDFSPLSEAVESDREERDRIGTSGPYAEGPDFGDEDADSAGTSSEDDVPFDMENQDPLVSPFASLPELPGDMADALEQFKLAIVRHRASGWDEISQEDALRVVDALRSFILARAS
jgi:hypothetical protein